MAATGAVTGTDTAAKPALLAMLRDHLEAAILPGDAPMSAADLDAAAALLLAAARTRAEGQTVVQIESETGQHRRLRIAIINEDMPFLVDSIAATVAAQGLLIDRLVHPVVTAARDAAGMLTALGNAAPGAPRESLIYLETERLDARARRALAEALRLTLEDVRAAVSDWPVMREGLAADAAAIAAADPAGAEEAALLGWLGGGMMTQLGHLTRAADGSESEVYGVCARSARELLAESSLQRAFAWFGQPDADGAERRLLIIKSNRLSLVHRRIPLDLFIVPRRESGQVAALSIHAGVWTSAALAAPPASVPLLRAVLEALTTEFGFDPAGHKGKALVHAFTTLPHDLMIAFDEPDTRRLATAMMSLVDRPRTRLVLVRAPLERHIFAFVWLPRDALSTETRLQIEALLTELPGVELLSWSLEVEGSTLAMLQFLLDIRGCEAFPEERAIEQRLEELLRGWAGAVEAELGQGEEAGRAAAIAARYAPAFPPAYRTLYGPAEAARDIARLRPLASAQAARRDVRLMQLAGDPAGRLRIKVAFVSGELVLSDAVPALENFGFRVLAENEAELAGGKLGTIHDFLVTPPAGTAAADLFARTALIEGAIADVLNGGAEDDPFNRLVIAAGIDARSANWLRALYRYLRQTGISYTILTVVDALGRAPEATGAMIELFAARHDPAFAGDRAAAASAAEAAFAQALSKVSAINDDRLLRLYKAVVDALLRTNAFAPAAAEALAFKIDSSLVPGLPKPVPWREIFVYSARVEGIHLRAGKVARGGLRWSDRRDDFRTEVLGLMKAQRVKNAVIVPTGAKGGFYPKQLPSPAQDREGWAAEGQAAYEIFIRTLLSLTDNIVGGAVVHPDSVVIHDGEDPYFVVAADKGTARFSDVANGIAEARDFWLGDAFASGGSKGYDHKAMGITARGAWVSVQRHFRELGVDVQSDPITVAGCGDMSGDVFGNGMLLSKALKLVAAFDHRDIFLDPAPDPLASWQERARLFALPRSSWQDYDTGLISPGGGVSSREAKVIALSPQVRALLGIPEETIEPEALIAAILRAPVDLMWFGGIGTYLKAAHENHIEVGDPANDSLRISASEARARVIGEGANLGITQAGRIEFALRGGRINTDFIDNSAGVDCSDNEVNIKIALAAARAAGTLTEPARIALLEAMTDEVAALVLEDNRLQALALSIAETGGPGATAACVRLIERLEELGGFDRRTEGLADGEALSRRAADGQGLTRPELAVLLSSAKLALQDAIEASTLPDDPALEALLIARFPAPMREAFGAEIRGHQLRRQMIATGLANRVVNRLGMIHPFELAEEEGVGLAEVAAALVVVEQMYGLGALWAAIDGADIAESARLELFERVAAAVGNLVSDALRTAAGPIAPAAMIAQLAGGVSALAAARDSLLSPEPRARSQALRTRFEAAGVPADLAGQVADLFDLDGGIALARTALDSGIDPVLLTRAFTDVGARLGLDWAAGTAAHMSPSDVWERLLVSGLARDFQQMRTDFLRRLLGGAGASADPLGAVAEWSARNAMPIAQFRALVARAQARPPVSATMLAQIASQARNLLER